MKNLLFFSRLGVQKMCERNPTIRELTLSGVNEVKGSKNVNNKMLEHTQNKHDNITKIAYNLGHNLVQLFFM